MAKQAATRLSGEDLGKFNAIKRSIQATDIDIKDAEILRMCIRYYYNHEINKKESK